MFFDQLKDLVQVGTNVLLDDGNQKAQLLEEELFQRDLRQRSKSHYIHEARDHLWERANYQCTSKQRVDCVRRTCLMYGTQRTPNDLKMNMTAVTTVL